MVIRWVVAPCVPSFLVVAACCLDCRSAKRILSKIGRWLVECSAFCTTERHSATCEFPLHCLSLQVI